MYCQQYPNCLFNHNPVMSALSDRLRAERERKGWSQDDLAREAKIRQSFIGALESKGQKTSGYLPEIAHALGVDAYWLKTGKGNKHGAGCLDENQKLLLEAFPLLDDGVKDIWLNSARAALKKADEQKRKAA